VPPWSFRQTTETPPDGRSPTLSTRSPFSFRGPATKVRPCPFISFAGRRCFAGRSPPGSHQPSSGPLRTSPDPSPPRSPSGPRSPNPPCVHGGHGWCRPPPSLRRPCAPRLTPAPCPIRCGGRAPRALAPVPAVARPTRRCRHKQSHAPPANAPPSPVHRGRRLPKQLNLTMSSRTSRCISSAPHHHLSNAEAPPPLADRAGRHECRRRPSLRPSLSKVKTPSKSPSNSLRFPLLSRVPHPPGRRRRQRSVGARGAPVPALFKV
jgi:hypothetical protein